LRVLSGRKGKFKQEKNEREGREKEGKLFPLFGS
jgi:hypothetical protein